MPAAHEPHLLTPSDRRRTSRFVLGLPVRIHLAGTDDPLTVELMDLSSGGARFRSPTPAASLNQLALIVFVLPGQRRCVAKGRVVRADEAGVFALRLDKANAAFQDFVREFAR